MRTSSQQSILVIDPDPSIRVLMVALLRRQGYIADVAGDPDEALRLHRSARHSAVVVDPRPIGGDSLLDALQTRVADETQSRNVIVVTTPDGSHESYAGRPAVHAVLFKPFVLDDLSAAVEACCNGAT